MGPRLAPRLLAARGCPTTRPSHRCESLPSGCRPWRSAGPPATEQRGARVRGSPGDRLEAGTAAGPLQPTFPQIQIRGPRRELRGHRPRPPSRGPAPGPVHWLAARGAPPPGHVPSRAPAAAPRCLLLFLFSFFLCKRSVVHCI